jgi:hypothetical protein
MNARAAESVSQNASHAFIVMRGNASIMNFKQ